MRRNPKKGNKTSNKIKIDFYITFESFLSYVYKETFILIIV